MAQSEAAASPAVPPSTPLSNPGPSGPLSPLFLSDRLIALAEQAGKLGCKRTASRLIGLASTVLEEVSVPPPPSYRAG